MVPYRPSTMEMTTKRPTNRQAILVISQRYTLAKRTEGQAFYSFFCQNTRKSRLSCTVRSTHAPDQHGNVQFPFHILGMNKNHDEYRKNTPRRSITETKKLEVLDHQIHQTLAMDVKIEAHGAQKCSRVRVSVCGKY